MEVGVLTLSCDGRPEEGEVEFSMLGVLDNGVVEINGGIIELGGTVNLGQKWGGDVRRERLRVSFSIRKYIKRVAYCQKKLRVMKRLVSKVF